MGFLTQKQLKKVGFKTIGGNVKISDRAVFYNPGNISIGEFSRIDDYCVFSAGKGGIEIGNFVHIAVFCSIIGEGKIIIDDFSTFSSRVSCYSSSDDYSGASMTNPVIDRRFKNLIIDDVFLGKHVIVGAGTIILPGIKIGEGCSIGALSLIKQNCRKFGIYAGIPAKFIKARKKKFLKLEKEFLKWKKI